MPIYEYKCPDCGYREMSYERGDVLHIRRPAQPVRGCLRCGQYDKPFKRVFGFSSPAMLHDHFNNTLGRGVSGMRDFREGLKIASDRATMETGIEHNYKPLEWGDHKAFGATAEGIHESNVIRSRKGLPILPEIKGG